MRVIGHEYGNSKVLFNSGIRWEDISDICTSADDQENYADVFVKANDKKIQTMTGYLTTRIHGGIRIE